MEETLLGRRRQRRRIGIGMHRRRTKNRKSFVPKNVSNEVVVASAFAKKKKTKKTTNNNNNNNNHGAEPRKSERAFR